MQGEVPDDATIQRLIAEFGERADCWCVWCKHEVPLGNWRKHCQWHANDGLETALAVDRWLRARAS